jgi:hypothetical protein
MFTASRNKKREAVVGKHQEAMKFAIRAELLGKFNSIQANAGDVLPINWLYDNYLPSLSPKEEKALEKVINEMQTQDLIEYVSGSKPTYRLTEKGKSLLC